MLVRIYTYIFLFSLVCWTNVLQVVCAQVAFISSKSTTETLEGEVKYIQS